MAIRYVKQRSGIDCGIAALAMACAVDYETVANGLVSSGITSRRLSEAMGTEGLNDDLVKDWLRRHDWAWQEMARNVWQLGGFAPRHPWPPHPFASTHICFVEASSGWHYCTMDFDGRVYDPWKEDRHTLAHPDYKRVGSVIGLYKVQQKRTEAA